VFTVFFQEKRPWRGVLDGVTVPASMACSRGILCKRRQESIFILYNESHAYFHIISDICRATCVHRAVADLIAVEPMAKLSKTRLCPQTVITQLRLYILKYIIMVYIVCLRLAVASLNKLSHNSRQSTFQQTSIARSFQRVKWRRAPVSRPEFYEFINATKYSMLGNSHQRYQTLTFLLIWS